MLPRISIRLVVPVVACAGLLALPLRAQSHEHDHETSGTGVEHGLRAKFSDLFIFGPGSDPLFLAGSAGASNPASIQAHGTHFIPAAAASNGSVIGFITQALGSSLASLPLSATTSGETFRFEGGVPVSTATSAGPIFAERAQTLGRGRLLVGLSRSSIGFRALRGVPLSDLPITFTHENVTEAESPGCGQTAGDDCGKMGVPTLENEVIQVNLDLDLHVTATSLNLTYGIRNRIDVGVVVPVVESDFHGASQAQVIPFGGPTAVHFFAGTPQNPVLSASRESAGSAFGVGDVAARVKVDASPNPRVGLALLADVRLPTGDVDNFIGSGRFSARGVLVASTTLAATTPHVNLGYLARGGGTLNDAVLTTVGFDQLISRRVTLAADVSAELQVGPNRLTLPGVVQYDAPFRRTVRPTTIPDMRDDLVNASVGMKFVTASKVTGIANLLVPLNSGGLRPHATYTIGAEYAF